MEEKQIRKQLRRSFRGVGWTLVIYYVLMNILVAVTMILEAFYRIAMAAFSGNAGLSMAAMADSLANNAWGYHLAVLTGLVILLCWKGLAFWKQEIWAKGKPMTVSAFFALLSVFFGCQVAVSLLNMVLEWILNRFGLSAMAVYESVSGASDSLSMFFYASIVAPVSEEILFRGYIQRTLQPFGKKFAIFGSAILFGLFHGNLVQTPYAFLVGLLLGYVAAEYSIAWAMVLHMGNNLVLADLFSRLTRNLPEMTADMLLGTLLWGFAIAAIVILAVNRQKMKAYLSAERMDGRCLRCFFTNSGFLVLTGMMVINMVLMLFLPA